MDENYWQKKWEENDIKFNQESPNPFLIEYFPKFGLANQATIFVPLCGKSIDMLWLLEQEHEVIGVELSPIAIEAFFNENKLTYKVIQTRGFTIYKGDNITIYCGDFFNLTKDQLKSVTGVYDRAALIALPAKTRKQYAEHSNNILGVGTQILLLTIEYKHKEKIGPPYSVPDTEIQKNYSSHYKINLLNTLENDSTPEKLAEHGVKNVTTRIYRMLHR